MEEIVFPDPAVAGILGKDYVEARLHTDPGPNYERISEVQSRLAQSVANPIYVVVDPKTEENLGKFEGKALRLSDFTGFLNDAKARHEGTEKVAEAR